MKNRLIHFLRRLIGLQNEADCAAVINTDGIPEFLRGRIYAERRWEICESFNGFTARSREASVHTLDREFLDVICYRSTDGRIVFGPFGIGVRLGCGEAAERNETDE
jgi:hypothetical protein